MLLGDLLARFNDPLVAEQALAGLDDLTLVTAVTVKADAAGLSTGLYAAECVETYADTATDEEWATLIGQMARSDDPGGILLKRALSASCSGGGTCGCGGTHA
ncbi:hypothetical protein ACJ4V0_09640 [Phreatobacter sp. HK31-P]